MLALVSLLGLACIVVGPGPARAQSASPDSARVAVPAAPARSPRVGVRGRPWHAQPWAIMMRSAIVPGWGQWTNRRKLKTLLAVGAEGYFGARVGSAWRDVNGALDREAAALALGDQAGADQARAEYDDAFNRRATAAWMLAAAVGASMLDAYVDAHFLQFDADFGPDPALPEERTSALQMRLGVHLAFTGP